MLDNTSDPLITSFRMGLLQPWEDGFDFSLPDGATGCFRLDMPADAQVLAGSAAMPVGTEFDTETLGACGDPITALTVDDFTVGESDGPGSFIVRLSGPANEIVSVDYSTADGTALAGVDYVANTGNLNFQPGDSTQVIQVDILDDAEEEGIETFNLILSNSVNAQIGDPEAIGTIQDDDFQLPSVCGAPAYNPAVDREAFLWKDCSQGVWRTSFAAGGGSWLQYRGTVSSDGGFASVNPVGIESSDVIDYLSVPTEINYLLGMLSVWTDGFDFAPFTDTGTCFELSTPAGTPVLVGPSRTPIATPFDLGTLSDCGSAPPPPDPGPTDTYNIVVVFADDQRIDTFPQMPNVNTRLIPKGVNFDNAYVQTPLCCPARASAYSGGFLAQNTGVLENKAPNGGSQQFNDSINIGTKLQQANYHTMFVGKWQHDYPLAVPYVPPGWSNFTAHASWELDTDWSSFKFLLGSSGQSSAVGSVVDASGQYHVYFERDQILSFLDTVPSGKPFLVFWAPTPPHPPATPAPGDETAFSNYTYRERGYGELDITDKPPWVQKFDPNNVAFGGDEAVRDQLRSILSVDRSLGAIIDKIEAQGKMDNTVLIVTSDNGYMWGEHKLWGKNYAYEESIRVPLLVVMPGVGPRGDDHVVSTVLDLGPTLYDIAGLSDQNTDGTSLLPLLQDPNVPWRNELYFEKYGTVSWANGLWDGLRRDNWKYVKYWTGHEELYDLDADPYELDNLSGNTTYAATLSSMAARTVELRRGLAIKPNFGIPAGAVGEQYTYGFEIWGGTPPFTWSVETGSLPPGLNLNSGNGLVSGVPTTAGSWTFRLRVTGSGIASQAQRQRTYVTAENSIVINN